MWPARDEEEAARIGRTAAEQEAAGDPDSREVAGELAERMDWARHGHTGKVEIDLPQYDARDFGSRRAIAQQLRCMALIMPTTCPWARRTRIP
jgi:hypothetical protein